MEFISKYWKSNQYISTQGDEVYIDDDYDKTPVKSNKQIKESLKYKQQIISKIIKYFLIIIIILFLFLIINLYNRGIFSKIWKKNYFTDDKIKENNNYLKKLQKYFLKSNQINDINVTVPLRDFKKPNKINKIIESNSNDLDNIRDISESLLNNINKFETSDNQEAEGIFNFEDNINDLDIDNEKILKEIKQKTNDLSLSKWNYQNFKKELKNHEDEFNKNKNELISCKEQMKFKKEKFNEQIKEYDEINNNLLEAQNKFNKINDILYDNEAKISKKDKEMRERLRKLYEDISEYENTLKNEDKIKMDCVNRRKQIHNDEFNIKVKKESLESEKKDLNNLESQHNELSTILQKLRDNLDKIILKEKFYVNKLNIVISNKDIQELLEGIGKFHDNKMKKLIHLMNIINNKQKEEISLEKDQIEDEIFDFDKKYNQKLNLKELMHIFVKLKKKVNSYDINQIKKITAKLKDGLKQIQYLKIDINNSIEENEKKILIVKKLLYEKNNKIKKLEENIEEFEKNIEDNQKFIKKKKELINNSKEGLESMKLERNQKEKEYKEKIAELDKEFAVIDREWKDNYRKYKKIQIKFYGIKEQIFEFNKDLNKKYKECEIIEIYLNDYKINFKEIVGDMKNDVKSIKNLESDVKILINKLIN